VCPVGAVSKTITEYSIDLTCLGTSSIRAGRSEATHYEKTDFMISAKLMASSTPGIAKARSCIMLPIIPLESAVSGGPC